MHAGVASRLAKVRCVVVCLGALGRVAAVVVRGVHAAVANRGRDVNGVGFGRG